MPELQEYQSFSKVAEPSGMPTQVLVLWLRDLLTEVKTQREQIAAMEARITALEP
ncbi:hypothetical protein [Loktanella sp. R86503]|uniref:hypothetical protein n=1 Tax=Loktanella sp. R86503 TaxID=3093847 RepID=UPI0036DF7C72